MDKRFLPVTLLAVALLFAQGGSLLIAALCPHLRPVEGSCHTTVAEPEMAHHEISAMAMGTVDSLDEPILNPDPNAVSLDQPSEFCPHCAVHSRSTPNDISLRAAESSRRFDSFANPGVVAASVTFETPSVAVLLSRAHGPPGTSTPRHILINIFRI